MLASNYAGISYEAWSLLFGCIQTAAVFTALVFGISQLRIVQRQRSAESLSSMHTEWREIESEAMYLLYDVPAFPGSLDDRASQLVDWLASSTRPSSSSPDRQQQCDKYLEYAPLVINALSNLSAYLENSALRERDLFSQMHTRLMEIFYALEPYILLVSYSRQSRWGLRVRRLGIGAARYHIRSRIQVEYGLSLRGVNILPEIRSGISDLPRGGKTFIPSMRQCAERDRRDMERIGQIAARHAEWERVAEILRKV